MVFFLLLVVNALVVAVGIGVCQAIADERDGERKIAICIAFMVAVSAGIWGWYHLSYQSEESIAERAAEDAQTEKNRAKRSCEDSVEAFFISHDFVSERLVSPSSAEYPSYRDSGVITKYAGNCTHEVWAYVDAQNAFGAQIRTKYYAKLKNPDGAGTWYVVELEM